MIKRICFLIPVFIFKSYLINAQLQDEYIKGTLHFTDGRKEPTLILNEETGKLNNSVTVQDSSSKKSRKKYTAADILSIEFENGKKFRQITFTPHKTVDTLTVLGRVLVTGRVNLYQVFYKESMILIAAREDNTYPMQKDEFTSNDKEVKEHFYNSFLMNALKDAPDELREKAAKIDFDEKRISRLIFEYNQLYNNPAELSVIKKENKKFITGGLLFKKTKNTPYAIWGFIHYRLYFTDFSRSTSFNTGFHYYQYQFKTAYSPIQTNTFNRSIASIPFFVQQNLLNKSFRPYVFGGFNLSYIATKAGTQNIEDETGFQKNYGLHFLGGAGIEINLLRHLMLKTDYRFENFNHGFMGGLVVIF